MNGELLREGVRPLEREAPGEAPEASPRIEAGGPGKTRRRRRRGRKRPGRFRRWVLRPLLWSLALLVVAVFLLQLFLNTRRARDWSRELITRQLSAYLDRVVTLEDITFELLPFSLEIWGFNISGPEGEDQPFLHIPWASVDLELEALQYRSIRLRQIRVERPEINLFFFPDGSQNLLKLRRGKKKGDRRFDVYIDRIEVDRAEFYLDHQKIRISVAADAVRARMRGLGELRLDGQLVAQEVVLRLPNAEPTTVSIAAKGQFQRGRLDIEQAKVSGPELGALLEGTCEWVVGSRDKKCSFHATADSRGRLLADLGYFRDLRGDLHLDGNFDWRPSTFGWRSTVTSPRLVLWDRELGDVAGVMASDRHRVRFSLERAAYAGGELEGSIEVDLDPEEEPVTVDLDFAGLELDTLLADQAIPVSGLASSASGQVFYRFPRREAGGGDGRGEVRLAAEPVEAGLPLGGAFPFTIDGGVFGSESIQLASESQSTLARGSFDLERRTGSFDYRITTSELGPLAELLPLSPEAKAEPLLWLPTEGRGELEGTLYLAPGGASADLRLDLEKVGTASMSGRTVTGSMHVRPTGLDPFRLELGDGRDALTVHGRIPFDLEQDPEGLRLTFDAAELPLAQARPWVPFDIPLDGPISGRLLLGVDAEGSRGRLAARLEPATLLDAGGESSGLTVGSLAAVLDWDAETLDIESLAIGSGSGRITGEGRYRWADQGIELALSGPDLELGREPMAAYLPRRDLGGRVALEARVGGTLERPEVRVDLASDRLTLAGRPFGSGTSRLTLDWRDGRLETRGRLLDMISLEGGGGLAPGEADLEIALEGSDISGLLELVLEQPPSSVDGAFAGRLEIAGPLGAEGRPEAVLTLEELGIGYRGRRLENLEPVRLRLGAEGARIESFFLGEPATGSDLFLFGSLGYDPSSPLDMRLQSSLSAAWLRLLFPEVTVEGSFDVLGRIGGSLEHPWLDGQGELRQAQLMAPDDFPHSIDEIAGIVLFYPEAIVLDHLQARVAEGRVTAAGRSTLPRGGRKAEYRFQIQGEDLKVRYPEGWYLHGDAELSVTSVDPAEGEEVQALVSGRLELSQLQYLDDLPVSFSQILRGFFERQRLEVGETDALLSAIGLNLAIDAPGAVRMRNNLADVSGSAELVLAGTAARPTLYGDVDVDPAGRLRFNNTDYEIRRGELTFANPYTLEPEVDLVAVTEVRDFDITLLLSGTLDRLETSFSSEPPLPDFEVFRMLATGDEQELGDRTVQRLAEGGSDQSSSAATFLYGQAASLIGERVGNLFGFDKFRIDPLTESGDAISKARITVGKRVSKDLFLTYSVDPSSTEEQRLRIEWEVDRGLTLVLTQNGDGSYSADARWDKSF